MLLTVFHTSSLIGIEVSQKVRKSSDNSRHCSAKVTAMISYHFVVVKSSFPLYIFTHIQNGVQNFS